MILFRRLILVLTLSCVWGMRAAAAPQTVWTFAAGASIQSSPAIGPDGTIYIGSDDGWFYAVVQGGALLWSFKTGGSVAASPAIGADGTVYVGSTDRVLYAFAPDGKVKWLQSPGGPIAGSPAVTADGGVVVATVFNAVVAYGSTGTKRWEFRAGGNIVSSPAVAEDGTIYFGAKDGHLYALAASGRVKWKYQAKSDFNTSPAIGADGAIFLGSLDGEFHAVNSDGSPRWQFKAGDAIRSSAAIGPDGTIYFGCDDQKLYAIGDDGKLKWACETGGQVRSSPAVADDGSVYVGSYDHKLYAIAADGSKRWEFLTGGHVSSSPTLRPGGTVIFGSWDKQLHVLSGGAALAKSSWPKFRGDIRQSGGLPEDTGAARLALTVVTGREVIAPALLKLACTLTGRDHGASKVEFFEGDRKLGELFSPPYSWIWADAPAGEHIMSARATLLSGKVVVSPQVTVRVAPAMVSAAPSPMPNPTGKPDNDPPRVFLIAPLTETEFESPGLDLRGKADDNAEVASVEYQLNDLPWQRASGTINWSAQVRLQAGENKLSIRAMDNAGNRSAELKRNFLYRLRLPLEVSVAGQGTVRSDQNDRLVEAGKPVTLRALPAKGHVFAGWTGSLTNPAPEITFVMREGLRLRAQFVASPFAELAGDFTGLVTQVEGEKLKGVGMLELTIQDRGGWSGKLSIAGEQHSVSGEFDALGMARVSINRGSKLPLGLDLKVDLRGNPELITGTVTEGLTRADMIGDRHVFDGREMRAPQAGQYTLVMAADSPEVGRTLGDGSGALTVDERGRVRFTGTLPDGTGVKFESTLSSQGVWPVFAALANGRGSLAGWVRFKEQAEGDLFGQFAWKRNSEDGNSDIPVTVLGFRYEPPTKGRLALSREEGMTAVKGGDMIEPWVERVQLDAKQKITPVKRSGSELSLTIAPGSGLFTGSFLHPVTGRLVDVQGAVLQRQNLGTGCFLGPTNAGRLSFTFDLREAASGP